jgi:hypothetical protein
MEHPPTVHPTKSNLLGTGSTSSKAAAAVISTMSKRKTRKASCGHSMQQNVKVIILLYTPRVTTP